VPVTLDAPDGVLRAALSVAYEDAWWVDLDRLVQEIRDPETKWRDSERFFLNWNTKGGGLAVDGEQWAKLADPGRVVAGAERVGLGFDGSISDDTTGLVGCTADGFLWVAGCWERPRFDDGRPDRGWTVPRLEVGSSVRSAFSAWTVGRMFGDPPRWATELESWAAEFGDETVLAFDTNQRSRFARAVDRFLTAVRSGALSHADDERLTGHVLAAALEKVRSAADEADGRTMYVLVKPEDGRKIDLAVAAVLAYEAAMTMPVEPVVDPLSQIF